MMSKDFWTEISLTEDYNIYHYEKNQTNLNRNLYDDNVS